jgi:hypothetical protein
LTFPNPGGKVKAKNRGKSMKDYIPSTFNKLLVWSRNFVRGLKANNAVLKIDSKTISDFEALTERYAAALEKAMDPNHNRLDRSKMKELARDVKKMARNITQGTLQHHPAMTQEIRTELMISELPGTRNGGTKKIMDCPILELIISRARVRARYINALTGRRAKPENVRGIQYKYAILDTPPTSIKDLANTVSQTSGELDIMCEENERGKALYVSAAWENSHGKPGPWSEIIKVYIA